MERTKWFDRKFDFEFTQNIFPSITERLRGTPVRLEEKLKNISNDLANAKINGSWSIKENIGHLVDLESLWMGRLEDILDGKTDLRATDLTNARTTEANHNLRSITDLLKEFRAVRSATIKKLNLCRLSKFTCRLYTHD